MVDGITVTVDTRAYNQAMRSVARENGKEIRKELFFQGKNLMPKLVRATAKLKIGKKVRKFEYIKAEKKWQPKRDKDTGKQIMVVRQSAGRARAGWIPAWKKLKLTNIPVGTQRAHKIAGIEGKFIDQSRRLLNPQLTIINEVPYIEELESISAKIDLAVALQTKKMESFVLRRQIRRLNRELRF